ncbi:chemotaxis protein CheA [Clostridium aestuarii]|uniref:Chemotaxis protein CheA n=1 Tax=Clostridium aestuarii TaxID=338193 RepID=A0ABT4D3P0_9CLOT|nr:chemotaxis protein CheA [Clostridium aestuarii]MCY6484810.1 chemotaxis protein CheA [Clostridium aestuarii]
MDVDDSIVEMFVFETFKLIEELESAILNSEETESFEENIEDIFRVMHTLKGNAAMMQYDNISNLSHSVEDVFDYFRKEHPENLDYSKAADIVLESIDFIKNETSKVKSGQDPDGDENKLKYKIEEYLKEIKNKTLNQVNKSLNNYKVKMYFQEDCGMENVRAFAVVHRLEEITTDIECIPADIVENNDTAEIIRCEGFNITFRTELTLNELKDFFEQIAFLKNLNIEEVKNSIDENKKTDRTNKNLNKISNLEKMNTSMLSVNVNKLDKLMDLVGELVISEAMVTKNPELDGVELDGFYKASRQLRKIINNVQDVVMSIRMVSLSTTFRKMNRLVRDVSKSLNKKVKFQITGENTEVDKNIIEHISDPLVHLIRNSIDHGIESPNKRLDKGKSEFGTVTLEAKNEGGDVWIIVKDDGRGLNKNKILKKAKEHGLMNKSENELTDKEIYSFIFLSGFSTKEKVSEVSGRGVGMDVVAKNIEQIRGSIFVDSVENKGTTISIKIPLTLAIIDGMTVKVGKCVYTIPTTSIKESFKVKEEDVIRDINGNEMILIRGYCCPIVRLYKRLGVDTKVTNIQDGIVVMVQNELNTICLFVDALLGQQQVVVKALPSYIKKVKGIAGCNLLGDGSISLILDIQEL